MLSLAITSVAGSCATRDVVEEAMEMGKEAGVVGRLFRFNVDVEMASSRLANGDPVLLGGRDCGAGDAGAVTRAVVVSGSKSEKSQEIDVVFSEAVGLALRRPL